jgi:hypothetical protein
MFLTVYFQLLSQFICRIYMIYMIHMFCVLILHIVMDIFEITIFMVNYILYVIIIMLIYEIKIIRKMSIILTPTVDDLDSWFVPLSGQLLTQLGRSI